MIFKIVPSILVWFLVQLLLIILNICNNSAEGIKVIGSTNVSTVQVGQPFTFKCEVTEYELNEHFDIFFYYNMTNNRFAYYNITDPKSTNAKTNLYSLYFNIDKKYISQVQPLVHRYPTYEVSITPKTAFSTEFYCNFYQPNKNIDLFFNHVPVTVTANTSTLPQITLTSNESTVHLNHPFTVTCTISNFETAGKKYLVNYFNNRNGLLAGYEVDKSGKALLSAGEFENVTTRFGVKSTFPAFDLVITEKADRKQNYWCELVASVDLNKKYPSPNWKFNGPFVDFTSTGNGTTEQRGKCIIDDLERYSELEYQVLFYSDLGPKVGENLLGYFWLKDNKVLEFAYEHLSPWTSIAHGPGVAYPNFEIVTKLNSSVSVKNWWCALNIGVPGQTPLKRPIKSNLQLL